MLPWGQLAATDVFNAAIGLKNESFPDTTSPTSAPTSENPKRGPSLGRIIGGVVGGFIGFILIAIVIFYAIRRIKSTGSGIGFANSSRDSGSKYLQDASNEKVVSPFPPPIPKIGLLPHLSYSYMTSKISPTCRDDF